MSFVCTARDSQPQLIGDSVVVPIGYDDAEPKSYSLLIAFDTMAGGEPSSSFASLSKTMKPIRKPDIGAAWR